MKNTFTKLTAFAVVATMALGFNIALAAAPQNASDNMTRQKAGELSDHVLTFTLPSATGANAVITFPGDFDLTAAAATGGTLDTGAGTITVTGPFTAGQIVTVTVTDVENPASAGNQSIAIATDLDTGSILVPIVADDQIRVTARVAQTLYFDVRDGVGTSNTATDNVVGFGDLEATNVNYATDDANGIETTPTTSSQFEAGTNAPSGYFVDVMGDTLTSMQNPTDKIDGLTAPTPAPVAGTESFGLKLVQTQKSSDTVPGSSDGTIAAPYAMYNLPASPTVAEVVVTNTAPSANEIYDIEYIANIASLTPAGDYATTLTYTMTANF